MKLKTCPKCGIGISDHIYIAKDWYTMRKLKNAWVFDAKKRIMIKKERGK